MKNLFDVAVANQVKTRLGKLEPRSEKRWGKMTAAQMLAHCSLSGRWENWRPKRERCRASDGATGEADGVSERRPATEEFADGHEPD